MDRAAYIQDLERQIAELEAAKAARQAADEHTRLTEELQPEPGFDFFAQPEPEAELAQDPADVELSPEPEPGPSMYAAYQHPAVALAGVRHTGHGVGGHAGLGAGVSN